MKEKTNKIKALLWSLFLITPVIIIIFLIYSFASFFPQIIDTLIFSFNKPLISSLIWIIILLLIPIAILEISMLFFNKLYKAKRKKQIQIYDAILCLFWLSELVLVGLLNYIIFIPSLNSNELINNYFVMYCCGILNL